ncbi:MAG: peptide deformylase [Candidatus Eisenbacteria bacterium]|nr:peptide deformylase [Candidatus Eisenbacteria bacterium]
MPHPIRLYGDPILRGHAREVEHFDEDLRAFAEEMIESMRAGEGIGLAAPQVGRSIRLIVVEAEAVGEDVEEPRVLVNPEIVALSKERTLFEEGCLSIPGVRADVERPDAITIRFRTTDGKTAKERAEGLYARVLQHEIDHLNGKLFIDHLGMAERNLLRKKLREIRERAAEVPRS